MSFFTVRATRTSALERSRAEVLSPNVLRQHSFYSVGVADLAAGRDPGIDLRPYRADRF